MLMAGCSHLSMAYFINREDANYKAIVTAIKKIRKRGLSDTAPVPTLDGCGSGLDSNAQDIHNPWAREVSQVTTVHAIPSNSIVGRHYVDLESAVPATIDAPEITAFPPMPLRAMGIRDLGHDILTARMAMPTTQSPARRNIQDAPVATSPPSFASPSFPRIEPSKQIRRRSVGHPPSRPRVGTYQAIKLICSRDPACYTTLTSCSFCN